MILVIDDNEDIRYTIREICEFAEWEVCEAATGKDGTELFKKVEPSLVLIDYHMANWDGLKTTKEIRKIDPTVPIIILTVDERHEIAEQFLQAGATDFALKPIKAPDLISRIRLNLRVGKLTKGQQDVFVDKGINTATLRTIKNFLFHQNDAMTITEIQSHLPVAYQTVHRYLNYLADKGEVTVISHYGRKGRPKNKYKMM
ncbi:response regulator [Sediminibacillus albus]|uniref:Response regulator of citrate/malate metabolism n=1 Tax=Sediminibacillus albus TaxID=407036 RepID=A0A1G8YRM6_9BACI|nr:response regulator [Sediminibacillus albus]SDK05074.1 Response regulator of citrate/malate metabolism [Sediminibacillus albus]